MLCPMNFEVIVFAVFVKTGVSLVYRKVNGIVCLFVCTHPHTQIQQLCIFFVIIFIDKINTAAGRCQSKV